MGSSFVSLGDKGFWASDGALQLWLHLLVDEIDKLPDRPHWLLQARQKWEEQSILAASGTISTRLDDFATGQDHIQLILWLGEQAMLRLNRYGDFIKQEELNNMPQPKGTFYTRDVETEVFKRCGRYFLRLLRGDLSTDVTEGKTVYLDL